MEKEWLIHDEAFLFHPLFYLINLLLKYININIYSFYALKFFT